MPPEPAWPDPTDEYVASDHYHVGPPAYDPDPPDSGMLPTCQGAGEIAVPAGPQDGFGNQDIDWIPCPGCKACAPSLPAGVAPDGPPSPAGECTPRHDSSSHGRAPAVTRVPSAPVTAEDFLPPKHGGNQ